MVKRKRGQGFTYVYLLLRKLARSQPISLVGLLEARLFLNMPVTFHNTSHIEMVSGRRNQEPGRQTDG